MYKSSAAKDFKRTLVINLDVEKYSLKRSIGVLNPKILEGNLLIKKVAPKIVYSQGYFGILVVKLKALATSRRCLFSFSVIPFC